MAPGISNLILGGIGTETEKSGNEKPFSLAFIIKLNPSSLMINKVWNLCATHRVTNMPLFWRGALLPIYMPLAGRKPLF